MTDRQRWEIVPRTVAGFLVDAAPPRTIAKAIQEAKDKRVLLALEYTHHHP